MPAKKKRNNKPKSAKTMNQNTTPITIPHSSTTFQHQEKQHKQEKASSMEDLSPKGKADEAKEVVVEDIVDVESVKTLEIADDDNNNNNNNNNNSPETKPEPVTEAKRDTSILEDIIDKAEKILDGDEDGLSSSSSSSSEDEKEAVVECEAQNEDKGAIDPYSVVEDQVSIVETELVKPSSAENQGGDKSKEAASSTPIIDIVDQKSDEVEENIGEESKVVADEAPIENLDTSHQITPNIPSDEPAVTRDSLQAASWKSCCGLFEVLRR